MESTVVGFLHKCSYIKNLKIILQCCFSSGFLDQEFLDSNDKPLAPFIFKNI